MDTSICRELAGMISTQRPIPSIRLLILDDGIQTLGKGPSEHTQNVPKLQTAAVPGHPPCSRYIHYILFTRQDTHRSEGPNLRDDDSSASGLDGTNRDTKDEG